MERQYDVHFIIPDSALLDNRFTLSTNKVNVIDVLNDLEAVSHISFDETEEGVFRITEKNKFVIIKLVGDIFVLID